jgi:hypothetical protein
MPIARVQMGHGRIGRFEVPEGTSQAAIESMAAQHSGLGIDPNSGRYDESLARLDMAMRGLSQGRPASQTRAPLLGGRFTVGGPARDIVSGLANVPKETSFPVVGATIGSLAAGPLAAGGMLARFGPSILGSALGGGAGGAAAESEKPTATPGSIARAGFRDAATMAAAEAGGLGLGALANRAIAPNIRWADPLKGVRERIAASALPNYLRTLTSRVAPRVPTVPASAALSRAARFMRSPLGGDLLESVAVPAVTATMGPQVGVPLYLARAAFAPGVAQRYLSRSQLPNELVRLAGRQTATGLTRAQIRGLLDEDDEDKK